MTIHLEVLLVSWIKVCLILMPRSKLCMRRKMKNCLVLMMIWLRIFLKRKKLKDLKQ
ncbi:hypothetical protein PFFVO_01169 [Plasmodium falciparum Vietnam Oak-Knoll (FVO)]|uniref:Uncharacterized protein n=1 Tax=Plasmodium falciparum Vietnam Oak-Knoll (FVO) TaxID=1036723 RepID=A0A024VBW0_PLAFA|nr:hypothetical protein PFFVO_01169 [Plasmodium falciparum Vietnam Oak-Knoll (FVO)]